VDGSDGFKAYLLGVDAESGFPEWRAVLIKSLFQEVSWTASVSFSA
jgi:hypothetical protein